MTQAAEAAHEPMTQTVVLECRSLSCCYKVHGREIHAVESADVVVRPAQIVGICGPSGCGKTTFLHLATGIMRPTTGEVMWDGKPLWVKGAFGRYRRQPPRAGYVMPVFQDPVGSLDPRWPIWRSVTEPLTAKHHGRRLSRRQRRAEAREQLARFGLSHIDVDSRPRQLSIGQCQRVAIARAIVAQPALLVADEPTSALDVTNAAGILRLFSAASEAGLAILIVSHDRKMLSALCSEVLEMRDGCLSMLGA